MNGSSAVTLRQKYEAITEIRVQDPRAIRRAADARTKGSLVPADGKLMIIACDHPARGANGVGGRPLAMGNRIDLLERLQTALSRPGVDGLLGSPDIIEDLLLLGALEGKVVFGSMNRGGLQGACFELDDQFTGYDAQAIADMGFNGGKTLTRVALDDPGTLNTLTVTATGADVIRVDNIGDFRRALDQARAATRTTVVHIETDPLAPVPSSESWWDVPVSDVSTLDSTQQAYKVDEQHKAAQRPYLTPAKESTP